MLLETHFFLVLVLVEAWTRHGLARLYLRASTKTPNNLSVLNVTEAYVQGLTVKA